MQFERKPVRVKEEAHGLSGVSVRAEGLHADTGLPKGLGGFRNRGNPKGELTQPLCLRIAYTRRCVGLHKELQFGIAELKVDFPIGLPLVFANHGKSQ